MDGFTYDEKESIWRATSAARACRRCKVRQRDCIVYLTKGNSVMCEDCRVHRSGACMPNFDEKTKIAFKEKFDFTDSLRAKRMMSDERRRVEANGAKRKRRRKFELQQTKTADKANAVKRAKWRVQPRPDALPKPAGGVSVLLRKRTSRPDYRDELKYDDEEYNSEEEEIESDLSSEFDMLQDEMIPIVVLDSDEEQIPEAKHNESKEECKRDQKDAPVVDPRPGKREDASGQECTKESVGTSIAQQADVTLVCPLSTVSNDKEHRVLASQSNRYRAATTAIEVSKSFERALAQMEQVSEFLNTLSANEHGSYSMDIFSFRFMRSALDNLMAEWQMNRPADKL